MSWQAISLSNWPEAIFSHRLSLQVSFRFSGNRVLITTSKHGLFIWDNGKFSEWKIAIADDLKQNIINKAVVLSADSSFAFGTISKGLYVVDKNGNLKYQIKKENGLQNNTILSLFEDNRKHLWLGLDQGIDLIKLSSPIISYQTNDNPLGSTYAAAIWKDKLYIGSNNGVFVKKWLSSEPFRPIRGLEGQTWNLKVLNNQLLAGHNDATFRIEENGIKKISSINGGWVFLPIATGQDTLLLQGSYTGLHIYKRDPKGIWTYNAAVKGIPPIPAKQIVRTKDGSLWIAHGVQRFVSYCFNTRAGLGTFLERVPAHRRIFPVSMPLKLLPGNKAYWCGPAITFSSPTVTINCCLIKISAYWMITCLKSGPAVTTIGLKYILIRSFLSQK